MPSISPFPHLTLFFFPSLYIPLSATTKQRKKKITLLAPAGAQALGSFLNLLHRTRRAFVLHAANEIRNPNPEKERKILKTKLSPHTTSYRQQYSAAERRTQTRHRNTQNLCNRWMDRSHENRRRESIASLLSAAFLRVFADRVSAGKRGCPGWNKNIRFAREYVLYTVHRFVKLHTYRIAYYT
jgi:hypothetical protein